MTVVTPKTGQVRAQAEAVWLQPEERDGLVAVSRASQRFRWWLHYLGTVVVGDGTVVFGGGAAVVVGGGGRRASQRKAPVEGTCLTCGGRRCGLREAEARELSGISWVVQPGAALESYEVSRRVCCPLGSSTTTW